MSWNNNEPFGAPKGTVRALIAILLTIGIVLSYILTGTAPAFLITAFSTITLFYFGSKAFKEFKN